MRTLFRKRRTAYVAARALGTLVDLMTLPTRDAKLGEKLGRFACKFVVAGSLAMFILNLTVNANWERVFHPLPICATIGPGSSLMDGHGERICQPARERE